MAEGFDTRKKAQENKFALDSELQFKIDARRRKMLALWAAENMGLDEEASLDYARTIVQFGIEDSSNGAVINKIINDSAEQGHEIDEKDLRQKNAEFEEIAAREVRMQQETL